MKKNEEDNQQELSVEMTGQVGADDIIGQPDGQASEKTDTEAVSALRKIKENVSEEDPRPSSSLTLRKILGGDILSAEMVRSQIWLIVMVVFFIIVYIAFRYQCQQDMIDIAQLESQLTDAKYKALSSSSTLTERCRESQVLQALRAHQDSTLRSSNQPPYKIYVPE